MPNCTNETLAASVGMCRLAESSLNSTILYTGCTSCWHEVYEKECQQLQCMRIIQIMLNQTSFAASISCPEMKDLVSGLNAMSINYVNETLREECARRYAKYCYDCDVQMDSCVLVGIYVSCAAIIILKQVIKILKIRFIQWRNSRDINYVKTTAYEVEMEKIKQIVTKRA